MDTPATPTTDRYINRELSLLEFNRRVLAQANDEDTPILERLRFLCISCTNLDEFFEIRVAAVKQRLEIGARTAGPDNMMPQQLLDEIRYRSMTLVRQQYESLNKILFPELEKEQIRFLQGGDWLEEQKEWLERYFHEEIIPVLTPITLDPSRPFPRCAR